MVVAISTQVPEIIPDAPAFTSANTAASSAQPPKSYQQPPTYGYAHGGAGTGAAQAWLGAIPAAALTQERHATRNFVLEHQNWRIQLIRQEMAATEQAMQLQLDNQARQFHVNQLMQELRTNAQFWRDVMLRELSGGANQW